MSARGTIYGDYRRGVFPEQIEIRGSPWLRYAIRVSGPKFGQSLGHVARSGG